MAGARPASGTTAGMRWLMRGLLGLCVLGVLGAGLALWLAVDGAPMVTARDDVTPADIDRALRLARVHDPRQGRPGRTRWLTLTERDLDLLLQQAARRGLPGQATVRLQPGQLTLMASLPALAGRWFNTELVLQQTATVPDVARWQVGRLPLPPGLALPLLRWAAERRGLQPDVLASLVDLERVVVLQGRLMASYRTGPQALQQLRAMVVSSEDQQRLQAQMSRLAQFTRTWPGDAASLADVLPPLLALAAERSAAEGADAAAEHRAALLALALQALGPPGRGWWPDAVRWPKPRPIAISLQQRHDLALHFIVSAVIAAESGTPLADAVGAWKELADARRGGSGFSYADLLADRAGTRFGMLAVRTPQKLKPRLTGGLRDDQLLPSIDGLPEQLAEDAHLERYGGLHGEGHKRLLAEIEARLDALPLYR